MAFNTVAAGLACQGTVLSHPVGILVVFACPVIVMGQGDALFLVTCVTIFQLHFGILFVRHLLRTGLRLKHQQAIDEQCKNKKQFLHKNPPFLEVVVEGNPTGPVVLKVANVDIILHPCINRHGFVDFVAGA